MKTSYVLSMVILGALVACTKQRDEYFPQGAGENLIAMKGFKVDYTLNTKNVKKDYIKDASQSEASHLEVGKNSLNLKKFNAIGFAKGEGTGYTTDADLIPKDYQFIGILNQVYNIKYKFNDKYLLIQKLVDEDTAPDFELRSFKKPRSNLVEPTKRTLQKVKKEKLESVYVTMLGCPIQYYRVENQLNRNLEKTKALVEISVRYPDEATHFRVKKESCKKFNNASVTDVLPKDYFVGEWHFSETLVDANRDMKAFQGFELNQKERYKQSSRIEFVSTQYSIRAVDTNISDEERAKKEKAEKEGREVNIVEEFPIVTIPLKNRFNFHVDENDALIEATDEKIHWKNREYVQLDFRGVNSKNLKLADEYRETLDFEISQDEYGNDFFSFVVNDLKIGARVRYAFRRINDGRDDKIKYEPRTYFQDDNKWFGFFTTEKTFVTLREKNLGQDDIDKNFLMARHNIKKGYIEYRFTPNSPNKYRPIAIRALKSWEDAFKKAGMNVEFRIDTNAPDVNLGDLRYNIINLIDESGGRFLFGYGPSIIDTKTGEIISATSNIRVNSIRDLEATFVTDYVREKIGFFENNYPCLTRNLSLPENIKYPKDYGIPVQSLRNKHCNTFRTTYYDKFKLIEKKCPKLKTYAEARVGKENRTKFISGIEKLFTDEGKKLVSECIDVVVEDQLLATLVHELGHNLGLRHNFKGSADKPNFWSDDWIKANMPGTLNADLGSSIMDYESPAGEALYLPGKYDVAALLFGYGNKIIKASGFKESTIDPKETVNLNPNMSIERNLVDLKMSEKHIRKFAYCTDEDVNGYIDPLCNLNDKGTTPLESTLHYMALLENNMALYGFRYDKPNSVVRLETSWLTIKERSFEPLRRMYEEWRWQLESRGSFPWSMYKKMPDPIHNMRAYMNQIQEFRRRTGDDNNGYFVASHAIFEFLLNMVMLPNKYCVGVKDGKLKLLELNLARNEFFSRGRARGESPSIQSCEDGILKETFKNEFDPNSYLGEVGFEVSDVIYNENQTDRDRQLLYDVEGFSKYRDVALEHLVRWRAGDARALTDVRGRRKIFPRFIDDPIFRHRIYQAFLDRIYHGVIIAPLGLDAKPEDARNHVADINKMTFLSSMPESLASNYIVTVPKFAAEYRFIGYLANTFKERLAKTQGSTGYEIDDPAGATLIEVEVSDQTTSACVTGQKSPRAEMAIEELLAPKKPVVVTPDDAPNSSPGPVPNRTFICPKDVQFSYMAKSTIEKFNLAKNRYVEFVRNSGAIKDQIERDIMGIELQQGLELMKAFLTPTVNEWGPGK
ncbi:MAG: hypothetical protein A4S09_12700 [Proteobacteria bacterium SG_bin7]|nr:MAG: hypothetical protein A4S09_12700 [Proteobacteria bacterium SG_bin7]